MPISIQSYSIAWSDRLIHRIEHLLGDVHFAVSEFFDQHQYPRRVPLKPLKAGGGTGNNAAGEAGADASDPNHNVPSIDSVSPAGSFMLRTTVHRTPFEEDHVDTGIGADVVVTIPQVVCTEEDLREGFYLERREAFAAKLAKHLKRVQQRAAKKLQEEEEEEAPPHDEEAELGEDEGGRGKSKKVVNSPQQAAGKTAQRLSRMEVQVLPIHNCFGCHEKSLLRLRFRRHRPSTSGGVKEAGSQEWTSNTTLSPASPYYYETPYVDIHFRPAMHSGRVSGAKAIRKHPLYSYLVLEDYLMPVHLQKLHQLCVDSPGLRRAMVLLKCWALHMGLHAPSSGHSEGLNGFLMAAMVLFLVEEGVVSPGMTEEVAARAVLVYIANGGFTSKTAARSAGTSLRAPLAEEAGSVPVMRFTGDVLNLLFRSSTVFFRMVVEKTAQETLQYPKLTELFGHTPFQPLALRHDVALTIHHCPPSPALLEAANPNTADAEDHPKETKDTKREGEAVISTSSPSTLYFPTLVQWAHQIRELALTALQSRATDVTVWAVSPSTLQLTIVLSSEADGRRRLTRGPAVEDTEAVEAFNRFWGAEITSTRQFSDGAIYRCVLWNFPEGLGTTATTQRVLAYALQRHLTPRHTEHTTEKEAEGVTKSGESDREVQEMHSLPRPRVEVSVLLGGLEGFLCEQVGGGEWSDTTLMVQKPLWEACKAVQSMMATLPKSAIPCKITGFDIISASERLTEVFPARPHLALTFRSEFSWNGTEETSSSISAFPALSTKATVEPIACVLTIDDRRRIPDDLEAIQLMKAAIGAQLSKALQASFGAQKSSDEKSEEKERKEAAATTVKSTFSNVFTSCHPHGVDVVYKGFLFRVYIAHYREISLLRALQMNPRADMLEQKLFWTVQHAKLLRSIAFGHHSFPVAARLAKRWLSAMCLYEFIPSEAVELLVAHAYLRSHASSVTTLTNIHQHPQSPAGDPSTLHGHAIPPPKTAASGFIRFIELLATHDWRTPLVLPTTDEAAAVAEGTSAIGSHVEGRAAALLRGQQHLQNQQQAMFIAAPYAPTRSPFTVSTPREMVMHRLVALARGALSLLLRHLRRPHTPSNASTREEVATEMLLFHADPSVFDIALPLHPKAMLHTDRVLHPTALQQEESGESKLREPQEKSAEESAALPQRGEASPAARHGRAVERVWQLDELEPEQRAAYLSQRVERDPAGQAVRAIRAALRDAAMVFYDALAPTTLYVVGLTPQPPTSRGGWQLAKKVCEAGMGAVLPEPVFLASTSSGAPQERAHPTPVPHSLKRSRRRGEDTARQGRRPAGSHPTPQRKGSGGAKPKGRQSATRAGHSAGSKRVRPNDDDGSTKGKKPKFSSA